MWSIMNATSGDISLFLYSIKKKKRKKEKEKERKKKWNSVKLLYVLNSGFDTLVNHKNKPHLSALPLRFVFCLRWIKYTFTGSDFVLDLIIPLKLSFSPSCIKRNWSHNWPFFHNRIHNSNCSHFRGGSRTAITPNMEPFVIMVNGF